MKNVMKNRMKKFVYLVVILGSLGSCKIVTDLTKSMTSDISNSTTPKFTKKGSPTYTLNGKKAERAVASDPKAPKTHNTISTPQKQSVSKLKEVDLSNVSLESFDARISSNEGSISYTFSDPSSNLYLSDIKKSDIKSIRIYNDSISCKILKYKFTQNVEGIRTPVNIVFLMDHSGSMGDDRANILQMAIDSALNYKHPDDEITLIKFDSRVARLITSKNKAELQGFLRPVSGLENFGYATAIQDAIKIGIDAQANSSIKEKMIVLLTDGCENSSTIAQDLVQVLTEAKKAKTIVNTYGFGNYVDQAYLDFISVETGGYFKQLYSRDEIKNVFNHSMFKLNNNFKINLSPCMFGDKLRLVTEVKLGDSVYTNERMIYSSFSLGESIELNVLFDVDKYNIKSEYESEINSFVEFLKKYPNVAVEIQGHTDSDGNDKHNQKLSENRAKSIKTYMVKKGIEASRITAVGYGETTPKYPNDTPENKQMNRRIEAKIVGN